MVTPLAQRTDALVARVDLATDAMLSRFIAIAELSTRSDADGETKPQGLSTAAATAVQVRNHTIQLVRAAEELRTIIQEVRECWILGTRTEKTSEAEEESSVNQGDLGERILLAVQTLVDAEGER